MLLLLQQHHEIAICEYLQVANYNWDPTAFLLVFYIGSLNLFHPTKLNRFTLYRLGGKLHMASGKWVRPGQFQCDTTEDWYTVGIIPTIQI